MPKIERIHAREVLDSRGNPTVAAEVECAGGAAGSAMVPSGASTGKFEAFELRDGDEARYQGKGVLTAVAHVKNEIHAALLGKDTAKQADIDRTMIELDGTPNKQRLGANAILATSLACARAEAASQGLPLYLYLQQLAPATQPRLPIPLMNVINGAKHADNDLSIQEFQIIPLAATTFSEALRMSAEVYHCLADVLRSSRIATNVGDEGGYAGSRGTLTTSAQVFEFLLRAVEKAGYTPGVDIGFGLDPAASEMYTEANAVYQIDGSGRSAEELHELYGEWMGRYPIVSLEDPFHQEGWDDWKSFTAREGTRVQIIGDDFFVTNPERIKRGIREAAANAVLIKPNQIGTLTETLEAILLAQKAGMNVVVSHRSGETADTFIADLTVATGAGQIKTGAPARSERTEKFNRLLEIEERLSLPLARPLNPYLERIAGKYQATGGMVYT